jgi:hypothetical protein
VTLDHLVRVDYLDFLVSLDFLELMGLQDKRVREVLEDQQALLDL